MAKLLQKHEAVIRRSRRMLIHMKELSSAQVAGECDDEDGECDADMAKEVMQCFGGREEMCYDEDEADRF